MGLLVPVYAFSGGGWTVDSWMMMPSSGLSWFSTGLGTLLAGWLAMLSAALLRESGAAFAAPLFERVLDGLGFALGVACRSDAIRTYGTWITRVERHGLTAQGTSVRRHREILEGRAPCSALDG